MSSIGRRCRARTSGTRMRTSATIALVLVLARCASPRPRPEPVALGARARCSRLTSSRSRKAYSRASAATSSSKGAASRMGTFHPDRLWRSRACPRPATGRQERVRAADAARYSSTPSYSFVYSGASYYGGGPRLYDGRICAPRGRHFRGGELAFSGSFGSFVQERRFAAAEFMGARLGLQSSAGRRSQAGGRFRSNRTGRWR
jgi:hypothetical protein